jgi:alkylation response protein AidB-like acyl-CoA dehydrogenase
MTELHVPAGGEFLLREIAPEQVFTPEMLSPEARMIARTMEEFMRKEVLPVVPRLEAQEPGLLPILMRKAGSLGLLAGAIPEPYGGLSLRKTDLALLAEKAAVYLSFAISIGVHTGVATLPLLFFGTEEQKAKYLPGLASGEILGSFALSEANSGSDALGARAKATLSPDGTHYRLTGEKLWITNGGFADLFTLFARVDGEQFTAFLIEQDAPGLIPGREERKMGLHGSSTRRMLLQEAQVPVANILGEVGKGHRPALYALNIGRFSIGVTALGAAKECLRMAARYAKQRQQFGRSIAAFDLIRHKLSAMAVRIYLLESMIYRVAGYWDALMTPPVQTNALEHENTRTPEDLKPPFLHASEEYAIECAMIKFFGTEVLGYVVDEALQIHGGFGYSEEFPIERIYRDARVFRIFEGTNEINRLTVLDQLLRRLTAGRLFLADADASGATTANAALSEQNDASPLLIEADTRVGWIRKTTKMVLREGLDKHSDQIGKNQCFAAAIADLAATLFALESAWLRAAKTQPVTAAKTDDPVKHGTAITLIFALDACDHTRQLAQSAFEALGMEEGPMPPTDQLNRIRNAFALRQQIADAVIEQEGYPVAS